MLLRLLLGLALTTPVLGQFPVAGTPLLPPQGVGPELYVADFTLDAVLVLIDLNGDGDANDLDEIRPFFDTSSPDPSLHPATPRSIAVDQNGVVYLADAGSNDFILRLEDLNDDGDANDLGEAQIYFDASSGGEGIASVSNIVLDTDGFLYFTDTGTSGATNRHITRIRDENGDGFCSAADGEVFTIYSRDTTSGVLIERTSGLVIDQDGSLIGSDFDSDQLYRFRDLSSPADGDADDLGEQVLVHANTPTLFLGFAEHLAFGNDVGNGIPLFVNGGPTEDSIFAFVDANLDGIYDNPTEVTPFWDADQVDGLVPANARTIVVNPVDAMTGLQSLFVIEAGQSSANVDEQIVILTDLNGDGDANDSGEARIYADLTNASGVMFGQPQGMALRPILPPPVNNNFVRSDCNTDGSTNIGDAVNLLNFLFVPDQAPDLLCEKPCDANDDGALNIADAITILNFLFVMGPSPQEPFPDCGDDPTSDSLEACVDLPTCP